MGVYLPLLLLVSIGSLHQCKADTSQDASAFKLSDLPVLKRSEIPSLYTKKRLGYVGRRHKDLGRDMKRSVYWELKPDFSANEIDWYDDPAKIRSDFNYKSFLEGLGSDDDDDIEEDSNNNIQTIEKKNVIAYNSQSSSNNDNSDADGKKEINIMLENQPALITTKTEQASKNSTGKKAGKSKVVKKNVEKTTKIASKNKIQKHSSQKKAVKSIPKKEHRQTHAKQHIKTKSHVANKKKTTKSSKKSTKSHQKAEKRDQTNVTMVTNVTKATAETLMNSSNLSNKSAEENAIAIAKSDVNAINATMSQTAQNSTEVANASLTNNTTSNSTVKEKVEEQPLEAKNKSVSLSNTTNIAENSTLSAAELKNNTKIEGSQNGNHTATIATKSGKKKSSVSSHHKKKHEKSKNKKTKTKTKKHHIRRRRSLEPADDDVDLDDDPCNAHENDNDSEEPREKRQLSENTSNKELGIQEQNEFENSHLHGGSRFKRSHRQPKLNANKKYFDNLLTQSTNVAVSRITRLNQNGTTALAKESVKQKRDNSHQMEPENSHQVSKRGLEQLFSPSVQNLINKFKLHQLLSQAAPAFSAANLPSATNVNEPRKEVAKATIPSSSSIIANLIPVAQSIIGPNLFTSAFSGGTGGKSPIENALDIVKRQNNYFPQQMKKSAIMAQQNLYGNQKKNNVSSLLQDVHNLQNNAQSTQRSELPQQPNQPSPDLHLMINEFHKRNLMQLMGKIPLKNLTHIFTRSKMNNETNLQVQDGASTHKHLEVPRINLPPLSIPRIHLPPIQPSITRLGTATSEGARRLKNEMKQKATNNKNLFRGKKEDIPALNNTDDATPTKKSDVASSHINGGAQEILRSFIHNNNHPSLALFLKRLEKGEEKENADASKKSKLTGEEGEHHGSNAANVIEKILNHKKVLMDNVEIERRSLHSNMKLRPSVSNALHNKGGGHNAQEWKRHKQNNINGGERKNKYEIYNALSKKSQKLDHFLKSLDGKISHNASGEKKENIEQPAHHHHSTEQLSKFSSIENHHNNIHHHGFDDVTTGFHNNDEHLSRDLIHHHSTPSKLSNPDFAPSQDSDGVKLKSEDRVTSSDNGDSHEKQDGVSRRSSLPHSRILAIAKMAIENPQLLSKIQRAAAEMNKKSDIPSANNEQSGNDPSHVGSIIPSSNLQDKQTRKTEVAHFNGESSPQSAAQTHHLHHKKQNIQNNADSAKSEKKDGEEEDLDRVTKDFVSPNSFAATEDITKAVSVAMHQLKRDKMYGEVYVRVHPGGKIRVMVQETRPQE